MFEYINPQAAHPGARYFQVGQRRPVESSLVLVVLSSLLLGGLSKLCGLPLLAGGLTVLVVALKCPGERGRGAHLWVDKLSLMATALFYLGLGNCLGGFALLSLPLLWRRR